MVPRYTELELIAVSTTSQDQVTIETLVARAEAARLVDRKATTKTQRETARNMKAFALEHGFKA